MDASTGSQTRPHRDIDIYATHEHAALAVLEQAGYSVGTDGRPQRVELVASGRGRVDVHPLTFDAAGNGIRTGPAGERYLYPAASFVTGPIEDLTVRCLSVEQQIAWHSGDELRESDHADLAVLRRLRAPAVRTCP